MTLPALVLRPARPDDCGILFAWSNLPEVRAASFDSRPIALKAHEAWFGRKRTDPACRIYIALDQKGDATGVIRFEATGGEGTVSITVAPTSRGHGYAPAMIGVGFSEASSFQKDNVAVVRMVHAALRATTR